MDQAVTAEEEQGSASREWVWTLAYAAVLLGLGVIALVLPFPSTIAIGIFMSWALCIAGVFGLVSGVSARRHRGRWLDAAAGMLSLVLGILLLPFPFFAALTLLWTLGLWFAASGMMEIVAGWRHEVSLVLLGALDLVLSALLISGSLTGDVLLVPLLAGVSFIATGAVTARAAFAGKTGARGPKPGAQATTGPDRAEIGQVAANAPPASEASYPS